MWKGRKSQSKTKYKRDLPKGLIQFVMVRKSLYFIFKSSSRASSSYGRIFKLHLFFISFTTFIVFSSPHIYTRFFESRHFFNDMANIVGFLWAGKYSINNIKHEWMDIFFVIVWLIKMRKIFFDNFYLTLFN